MLPQLPVLPSSIDAHGSFGRWRGLCLAGVVAALLAAGPAWAKPDCLSNSEFEADQALRLHSAMMVAGLKCHQAYKDQNPFGQYAQFTSARAADLRRWEAVMIGHFRKVGGGTQAFDTYRTEIANEISRTTQSIPFEQYCTSEIDSLAKHASMTTSDLKGEFSDLSKPSTIPLCSASTPAKPGKPAKPAKPGIQNASAAKPSKPAKPATHTAAAKPAKAPVQLASAEGRANKQPVKPAVAKKPGQH